MNSYLTNFKRQDTDKYKNVIVNKIGLRNPGIDGIHKVDPDKIVSVSALVKEDWDLFLNTIHPSRHIEVNLSCPNVEGSASIADFINERDTYTYLIKFLSRFRGKVQFKLPPDENILPYLNYIKTDLTGIDDHELVFHMSNTTPIECDDGVIRGASGYEVKDINMKLIPKVKNLFPDCHIIGGGGIYTLEDLINYRQAGCDSYSLSTLFLKPSSLMFHLGDIRSYIEGQQRKK